MNRDHMAKQAEITEVEDFDDTTLQRARLTVCGHSDTPEQARDLMLMLGIDPSQQDDTVYVTKRVPTPTGITHLANPVNTSDALARGSFDRAIPPSTSRYSVHQQRFVADPQGALMGAHKKAQKAKRKLVAGMLQAVEDGESYTILKAGQPAAILLPIADWYALQGAWLDLLKPMREVASEELTCSDEERSQMRAHMTHHVSPADQQRITMTADERRRQGISRPMTQEELDSARLNAPTTASGRQRNPLHRIRISPRSVAEPAFPEAGEGALTATVYHQGRDVTAEFLDGSILAVDPTPARTSIQRDSDGNYTISENAEADAAMAGPLDLSSMPVDFTVALVDGTGAPITAQREQPIADQRALRAQVRAEVEAEVDARVTDYDRLHSDGAVPLEGGPATLSGPAEVS